MRFGIRDLGFGIRKSAHAPIARLCTCSYESQIPNPESRPSSQSQIPSPGLPANPKSRIPNPGRTKRATGFTLLEVIAAIMLLAIAFTALMRVAGGSIRLSQNAANHSEAALWARSLLDTAFTTEPIQAGTTSGKFDERFRWQLAVSPWRPPRAPPNPPLQLYQLDLEVMWGPSAHPHSAHFRTLRLASAAGDGANGRDLR